MTVVADVRSHLEIGQLSTLLHQIARGPHVVDLETDVLNGAHDLALVLGASRRVTGIQRRIFCLEIAIGAWCLDVIAAPAWHIATAGESEFVLIERDNGIAALRVDANVLEVSRDTAWIEELAASEGLLRAGVVLHEIELRGIWTDHAKNTSAIGTATDRRRIQTACGIDIVQAREVGALKADADLTVQGVRRESWHHLDVLVVVDLEEHRRDSSCRIRGREGLGETEHSLVVPTRLVEVADTEGDTGYADNWQIAGRRGCDLCC